MSKFTSVILILLLYGCTSGKKIIEQNVNIDVYTYEDDGKVKAAAMPQLKGESSLQAYRLRFDYLLINVPHIHGKDMVQKRIDIWSLYPDTVRLSELYLQEFSGDKKLKHSFMKSYLALANPKRKKKTFYSKSELMNVASKFFYCDDVLPDTTVQMHICVGLNGIKEANWDKDYTLLEAFCYEAIFHELDLDKSLVDAELLSVKDDATKKYKPAYTIKEAFLENVKLEVFERMKRSSVLEKSLMDYYQFNSNNLAFKIQ
jgi:hypothetical protein